MDVKTAFISRFCHKLNIFQEELPRGHFKNFKSLKNFYSYFAIHHAYNIDFIIK